MRRLSLLLVPLAVCLVHAAAAAPAMTQAPPDDHYLPPLLKAERQVAGLPAAIWGITRSPEIDGAIQANGMALDDLGIARSFVGDIDGAITVFDTINRVRLPPGLHSARPLAPGVRAALPLAPDVQAEDAIEAIVAQARSKRAVLINEAHYQPMNRAFAQKLATALGKIGYRYLACEAFSWPIGPKGKTAPTQANLRSGYYMRDPVFGGLVNTVLADGWALVEYDDPSKPAPGLSPQAVADAREQTAARNLVERIFAKDKDAKVLILVGHAHLSKSKPDDKDRPVQMGEYLHRLTGFDMLHVEQAQFFAHPDRAHEAPLYAALVDKFSTMQPFVLRAADGSHPVLLGMAGRVDMQVIFPRYPTLDGRPDWLRTLAGRSARPVSAELLPTQGRRLVKALRMGDPADAVPADIVLVEAGKPAPVLMLPPGEFRYAVEDE